MEYHLRVWTERLLSQNIKGLMYSEGPNAKSVLESLHSIWVVDHDGPPWVFLSPTRTPGNHFVGWTCQRIVRQYISNRRLCLVFLRSSWMKTVGVLVKPEVLYNIVVLISDIKKIVLHFYRRYTRYMKWTKRCSACPLQDFSYIFTTTYIQIFWKYFMNL